MKPMKKAVIHIAFWILIYGVFTLIFARWVKGYTEAFYYVSLLMPVIIATTYFFNYYLVPVYLFRRRFFLFGLYTFYMLVVSLCLELLASILSLLLIIYYRGNETGPLFTDVFTMAGMLYFVVLLVSFFLLIRNYFKGQSAMGELERDRQKLERGYYTFRSNRKTVRIPYSDILYIESMADYIRIHRISGPPVESRMKISHMEQELPDTFLRIHRSFIVNREKIHSFSRETVLVEETGLPVSRSYRKQVAESLQPR